MSWRITFTVWVNDESVDTHPEEIHVYLGAAYGATYAKREDAESALQVLLDDERERGPVFTRRDGRRYRERVEYRIEEVSGE